MVWGVAGLVHAVGDALAARFSSCAVRGEISGFSRAASGHCYLSLKDADGASASIRCAMFRRAASLVDFAPADGQLVEVRGRLAVYEPRGELQFVVESMQRAGAGSLYEQFLRLKAQLEAQGLFDPARKRAIAAFPARIGVVTSLGAAALHDVLTALARRSLTGPVVQGDYAVVGDSDGYLHWLRLDDGELAARERVGGKAIKGQPVVVDGILVVQNVEGGLTAFRLD